MKRNPFRYFTSRKTPAAELNLSRPISGHASSVAPPLQPVEAAPSLVSPPMAKSLIPGDVASAAVINDNNARVSAETLTFYLKGIFSDADALEWIQSQLSRKMIGRTFEDVEKNIELLLSKGQRSQELITRMSRSFVAHKESTRNNQRAYAPEGRENPNAVFWPDPTLEDRSSPMSGRSLYTELPFAKKIRLIDKTTRIVSAGSCFATEIAHALQRNGYRYLIKEENKGRPGSYEFLGAGDLPNSSAAWGIIFNTPSFRQLVEKAFEVRSLPRILWTQDILGKLRYLDPFRENIGFDSPEAYDANYSEHVGAAREAFLEMDVFIITLGLNEIWYFKADGAVFSRSPWRTAPSLVGHRIMTVQENVDDLVRMTEILRAHNPNVSIICTLSPIALHATFRGDENHIVTANAHSKAVLRVAAEEFARKMKNVYYFPSYETVTVSTETPWLADQRHVSDLAVQNVMKLFHAMFEK
jgi:hypothetical protein